jgi:DNA-binding NtrC family response regulator
MRNMLTDQLAEVGFRATQATGVEDALAALEDGGFSAVLTDFHLHPNTGFELLEKSRHSAPVIIMSAFPSPEFLEEATSRGAAAVLSKPFCASDLIHLLESLAAK